MQSIKKYNPEWEDNHKYFLTDSTFLHYPYFKTEDQKQIVYSQFKKIQQEKPTQEFSLPSFGRRGLRGGFSYPNKNKTTIKNNYLSNYL